MEQKEYIGCTKIFDCPLGQIQLDDIEACSTPNICSRGCSSIALMDQSSVESGQPENKHTISEIISYTLEKNNRTTILNITRVSEMESNILYSYSLSP